MGGVSNRQVEIIQTVGTEDWAVIHERQAEVQPTGEPEDLLTYVESPIGIRIEDHVSPDFSVQSIDGDLLQQLGRISMLNLLGSPLNQNSDQGTDPRLSGQLDNLLKELDSAMKSET